MVSFVATLMSLSKQPRLRYHVGWAFIQSSERGGMIKYPRRQRRQLVARQIPARSQRCQEAYNTLNPNAKPATPPPLEVINPKATRYQPSETALNFC
jgi:hypothetical protein